jgi:hypothetical protein
VVACRSECVHAFVMKCKYVLTSMYVIMYVLHFSEHCNNFDPVSGCIFKRDAWGIKHFQLSAFLFFHRHAGLYECVYACICNACVYMYSIKQSL